MLLIANLDYVMEHTKISRISYGFYQVDVDVYCDSITNITTNSQAYDRIRFDDYLHPSAKGSGGLTLKQAYHSVLSDYQISLLNRGYNNKKY